VMSDESVPPGELVLTSGGDGVFPKGLLVGRVTKVSAGNDLFLNIRVRPAADLSKLEEVLVVTKIDERQTEPDQAGAARAVDILAERLPTVPAKAEAASKDGVATTTAVPHAVAPNTVAPRAGAALPASNPKPKTVPAQAAAGNTPAANKAANTTVGVGPGPGSPSATSPENGSTTNTHEPADTVTPKPEAPTPPQADSQDNPH
jgi:rod shape-determining protein MreC